MPVSFALAWAAGYARARRGRPGEPGRGPAGRAEREREAGGPAGGGGGARPHRPRAARRRRARGQRDGGPGRRGAARRCRRAGERAARRCSAIEDAGRDGAGRDAPAARRAARRPDEDARAAPRSRAWPTSTRWSTRSARTGLTVDAARRGRRRVPLPPALDLSAYRIVQEALTNVLKHAPARRADGRRPVPARTRSSCEVARRRPRRRPPARRAAATAWSGMRERVAIYGGSSCDAGPAPAARLRAAHAGSRCRWTRDDHPGAGRRRPGAGPGGLPDAARRREPDIEVVGEAADGAEAVRLAARAAGPTSC